MTNFNVINGTTDTTITNGEPFNISKHIKYLFEVTPAKYHNRIPMILDVSWLMLSSLSDKSKALALDMATDGMAQDTIDNIRHELCLIFLNLMGKAPLEVSNEFGHLTDDPGARIVVKDIYREGRFVATITSLKDGNTTIQCTTLTIQCVS